MERDCNTCAHHVQAASFEGAPARCWNCAGNPELPNWSPKAGMTHDLGTFEAVRQSPTFILRPMQQIDRGGRIHTTHFVRETTITPPQATALPTAAAARKAIPIYSGFVAYFPDAMAAVAELSRIGNDQHNPGKPLFWDRSKSGDELDALTRHLVEAGTIDTDGIRHSAKVAWRAMANLQKEIEAERARTAAKP